MSFCMKNDGRRVYRKDIKTLKNNAIEFKYGGLTKEKHAEEIRKHGALVEPTAIQSRLDAYAKSTDRDANSNIGCAAFGRGFAVVVPTALVVGFAVYGKEPKLLVLMIPLIIYWLLLFPKYYKGRKVLKKKNELLKSNNFGLFGFTVTDKVWWEIDTNNYDDDSDDRSGTITNGYYFVCGNVTFETDSLRYPKTAVGSELVFIMFNIDGKVYTYML